MSPVDELASHSHSHSGLPLLLVRTGSYFRAMKIGLAALLFVSAVTASSARPLDVFFFGDEGKALALFKQEVAHPKYRFLVPERKVFAGPKPIQQNVIDPPPAIVDAHKVDNVLAAVIVDPHGKVVDVAISETSDERISPAVKRDLAEWRFQPARNAGEPVACLVFVPLSFDFSTDAYPELTELVFCHQIEAHARSTSRDDHEFLFVYTDAAIEARILRKYRYPWLRPAADFVFNRNDGYQLKENHKITGTMLSASHFETTTSGMRCILEVYSGPAGTKEVRYYLKKTNVGWEVERVEPAGSPPVS